MKKIVQNELIKIAKLHEKRLSYALKKIALLIPFTENKIKELSDEDIEPIELMTSRFSKLHDFIGTKIINLFLDVTLESHEALSMIDKLNKLERLNILEDKDTWLEMSELRNHLAHEYPDHPELIALFLNQTYSYSHQLIEILKKLLEQIERHSIN